MKVSYEHELAVTGSILEGLFDYNPKNGNFYWKKFRGNTARVGTKAGYVRPDGYVQIKIKSRCFMAHRIAWAWMKGEWPDKDIDHINRNKSDNRISNLRTATRSENCINANNKKNNTSGHTGVFWKVRKDGREPRWWAFICVRRKIIGLGHFINKKDAVAARKAGEIKYFGKFARIA